MNPIRTPIETAFIALGSNIGDREQYIRKAVAAIHALPSTSKVLSSNIYETAPQGDASQDAYLNSVMQLQTSLSPMALLKACLEIELQLGRVRTKRWAPRTIDIDILLFGDISLRSLELTIPHPSMHQRDFVLKPLRELVPGDFKINGQSIDALIDALLSSHIL